MTEHDDIQRQLAALLAEVEPSPDFAARVRSEIDARLARRPSFGVWWMVSACASAVVLVAVGWRLGAARAIPASLPRVAVVTNEGPAPQPTFAPTSKPHVVPPVAVGRPSGLRASVPGRLVERALVPVDERVALAHYLSRWNAGGTSAPDTFGPRYDDEGMLVAPLPLTIAPLPPLAPPVDIDRRPDEKDDEKDQKALEGVRKG